MTDTEVLDPLADEVVDDLDITDLVEDDDPASNEGDEVVFDLGDDAKGGA